MKQYASNISIKPPRQTRFGGPRDVARTVVATVVTLSLLAACSSGPVPNIRRDSVSTLEPWRPGQATQAAQPQPQVAAPNPAQAPAPVAVQAPAPIAVPAQVAVQPSAPVPVAAPTQHTPVGSSVVQTYTVVGTKEAEQESVGPRPQLKRGTGRFIDSDVANAPPPGLPGTTGQATFNFEGESLHAVVKAILGDMLDQNYVIAPGVQGTVTLATPKAVSPAEAINLLDQVLGWNNARMIYSGGRYNIVAADQALSGTVAPRVGNAATARGFEVRAVPLKYVAAEEMKKILEPYARPNAIVDTDSSRNVISIGGTRAELQNYLRTIEIFDVDWLAGMSVGVFPLQAGKAVRVVEDLEKVFGQDSKSPVAGMFRFMPLEGTNAIMVITSQSKYLDDIQQWLDRIDGAGGSVQLYSYELKYIKARDLADRLAEVFGGSGGSGGEGSGRGGPGLMPGLDSAEISSGDRGSSMGFGDKGGGGSSGGGSGDSSMSLGNSRSGNGSVSLEIRGDKVGVSAVEETNALLVRSTPQAWKSIRDVIDQLDVMPMQVHIEAQVVEVQLSGELEYGVNWFFENAVTDNGLPDAVNRTTWSTLSGSVGQAKGNTGGLAWTFLGRNAAAVIKALDSVTDVNMLQTPSVLVRNNAEATFNVGSRIPVSSVTVNPGTGTDNSYSQVQYLDTGVILKVRPRIAKDGMVFLDIVQEVSAPGGERDKNGNVRIDTRKLKTEAAIQSGETVMLAGLIRDSTARGSKGLPGLSRIPVVGGLFGTQASTTRREETIVLLTPKIIRDPKEARDLTDEYGRRFRAMEPLHTLKRP